MNPLQDSFNTLHSLILRELFDADDEKVDKVKKSLYHLISAYNGVCKGFGYEPQHDIKLDMIMPPEDTVA